MAKIIGNTTATPNPQPNWTQTDSTKADYIKNKPEVGETVTAKIENGVLIIRQAPGIIAKGLAEEDREEIIAEVLASIPVAEEVSV